MEITTAVSPLAPGAFFCPGGTEAAFREYFMVLTLSFALCCHEITSPGPWTVPELAAGPKAEPRPASLQCWALCKLLGACECLPVTWIRAVQIRNCNSYLLLPFCKSHLSWPRSLGEGSISWWSCKSFLLSADSALLPRDVFPPPLPAEEFTGVKRVADWEL